jgi:hypothetical protein
MSTYCRNDLCYILGPHKNKSCFQFFGFFLSEISINEKVLFWFYIEFNTRGQYQGMNLRFNTRGQYQGMNLRFNTRGQYQSMNLRFKKKLNMV